MADSKSRARSGYPVAGSPEARADPVGVFARTFDKARKKGETRERAHDLAYRAYKAELARRGGIGCGNSAPCSPDTHANKDTTLDWVDHDAAGSGPNGDYTRADWERHGVKFGST